MAKTESSYGWLPHTAFLGHTRWEEWKEGEMPEAWKGPGPPLICPRVSVMPPSCGTRKRLMPNPAMPIDNCAILDPLLKVSMLLTISLKTVRHRWELWLGISEAHS